MTHSHPKPLITIGLPVYNGGEMLSRAIESLLAQDDTYFKLLICDNASTDQTQSICESFASQHSHVCYHRNESNIGAMGNFNKAIELASNNLTGNELFVFAAHDDMWSPGYLSSLRKCLEAAPEAILATPLTEHVNDDGSASSHSVDRPALGTTSIANLERYLADHACTWIYGLYKTSWIKQHFPEIAGDTYASDLLWMTKVILSETVVGTDQAIIYKRIKKSDYTPTQQSERVRAWMHISRRLSQIAWEESRTSWERARAMQLVTNYCYRKFIRRGNPISTFKNACQLGWTAARLPAEAKRAA